MLISLRACTVFPFSLSQKSQSHSSKEQLNLNNCFVCVSAGGQNPCGHHHPLGLSGTAFGRIAPHRSAGQGISPFSSKSRQAHTRQLAAEIGAVAIVETCEVSLFIPTNCIW